MKHLSQPDTPKSSPTLVLTSEGMAWLGVAFVLVGLGWWKSISLVLLLAYIMLALLVINGLLARVHTHRIVVTREPNSAAYAGESAIVRIRVTNTGTQNATAEVEDRAGGEPVAWLVNRLAPGAAITCEGRRDYRTRGRYTRPPHIVSAYPLGLLECDRRAETDIDLVVLPAPGNADPDGLRRWLLLQSGGDGRARKVLRRVTADQADVRGVRPYRPGDPIRTIHWRSSARRHELLVREYDAAPAPDLVLLVEPWLPANPTAVHTDALEAALSLATTIARSWCRVYNTRLVIAVAGDPNSLRVATGSEEGVREALTPLADVTGETNLAPLPARVFDRSLSRAARIVVSSRPNSPYADAMSAATGRRFLSVSPADHLPWYHPPAIDLPPKDRDGNENTSGFALTPAGVQTVGSKHRK